MRVFNEDLTDFASAPFFSGNNNWYSLTFKVFASLEIDVSTNIKGLIGVQLDVYRDNRNTIHVCARMNRRSPNSETNTA